MAYYLHILVIVLVADFCINQVASSQNISITLLESAVASGAVCLDGSPPGYYYAMGSDEGLDNWIVNLQGGAWCVSSSSCQSRQGTELGSSTNMSRSTKPFDEILSGDQATNPEFYNWNRVLIAYCDGSSFLGDVEEVDRFNNSIIRRRGLRIFHAVIEDLLSKGMENASMAILAGDSAGGLGALLHCDGFRALLPNTNRVKCIIDAGFFLYAENLTGAVDRATFFRNLVEYHGINKSLPAACTSNIMDPSLKYQCIFPENFIKDIHTPLFILQAAFDLYQLPLLYYSNRTDNAWKDCIYHSNCSDPESQKTFLDFRTTFLDKLQEIRCSPSVGIFVVSCYNHSLLDIVGSQKGWSASPMLGNKTIAVAVGDWFFDRSEVKEIDTDTTIHYCY